MHGNSTAGSGNITSSSWFRGLDRRDLYLLPLLAIGSAMVLVAASEIGARLYAPAKEEFSCVFYDTTIGTSRAKPNCVEEGKIPEGPVVTYSYNECGYRGLSPCGPKPADTKRVVVLGGSFAEGYAVPYEESFSRRAQLTLTKLCGFNVDVQNLGVLGGTNLVGVYREMAEALALKPDLILFAVLPYDLAAGIDSDRVKNREDPPPFPAPNGSPPFAERLRGVVKSSRAFSVAQHFMLNDSSLYVKSYLALGERSDFLRTPFSAAWTRRMSDFDILIGEMSAKAHATGVPFALLYGTQRAQAAILGGLAAPHGIDATALPRTLDGIAAKHDILMIDTTSGFARMQKPEFLIYTVDGHPNSQGHAVIADSLVARLLSDPRSPFVGCRAVPPSE